MNRDDYVESPLPIENELRRLFDNEAALTIFDIGACEGEDTIRYARRFPRSIVYAVEPLPANVARIRSAVVRYGADNVRIVPLALANAVGRRTFFVSSGRPPRRRTPPTGTTGTSQVQFCRRRVILMSIHGCTSMKRSR